MRPLDWLKAWKKNEIPFNQGFVNPYLKKYSYLLKSKFGNKIFVPLCGKSIDMLWLSQHGFSVVGIELSPIAVQAFFNENDIQPNITKKTNFEHYSTKNIQIFCGNYFDITSNETGKVNAIYDRAALSALPKKLRPVYARQLLEFLSPNAKILLITIEYDSLNIEGPPYSISKSEIIELYANRYKIEIINEEIKSTAVIPQHFLEKGIKKLIHRIYLLEYFTQYD